MLPGIGLQCQEICISSTASQETSIYTKSKEGIIAKLLISVLEAFCYCLETTGAQRGTIQLGGIWLPSGGTGAAQDLAPGKKSFH